MDTRQAECVGTKGTPQLLTMFTLGARVRFSLGTNLNTPFCSSSHARIWPWCPCPSTRSSPCIRTRAPVSSLRAFCVVSRHLKTTFRPFSVQKTKKFMFQNTLISFNFPSCSPPEISSRQQRTYVIFL